jgi:Pentapeptide repeats (9 copies)
MKTMLKSHAQMITWVVLSLILLCLHVCIIFAQSSADTSKCEMENVPLNPKTNKPCTGDALKQEPFIKSISKEDIKQCLQARKSIKNHHIVFKEYRDAWKEVAEELGTHDIPLCIEGGVLHAETRYECDEKTQVCGGSIDFWAFRDPTTTKDVSQLTQEEWKTFGITQKDTFIVFIHPQIRWGNVFIDTVVSTRREEKEGTTQKITRLIFSNEANFHKTTFRDEADFRNTAFSDKADFSYTNFSSYTYFIGSTFVNYADFSATTFSHNAYFHETIFRDKAYFIESIFLNQVKFNKAIFNDKADFSYSIFSKQANFMRTTFSNLADFSDATFSNLADFSDAIFSNLADFNRTVFKDNADFRDIRADETLRFDNTTWEGRVDLRGASAEELHWFSKEHSSEVKDICDLREATIGRATFTEIRFQDVVDFSRTRFGPYKIGVRLPRSWNFRPTIKVSGPLSRSVVELQTLWTTVHYPAYSTDVCHPVHGKVATQST